MTEEDHESCQRITEKGAHPLQNPRFEPPPLFQSLMGVRLHFMLDGY